MNAPEILVIILSIFLALFLALGIVLVILLIRVTYRIKKVTDSAQRTVDVIESAAVNVSRVTSPLIMMRLVKDQLGKFTAKKEGKHGKK